VPWSRLPRLRRLAPESYDTLVWHSSWTALVFRFVLDGHQDLYRRMIRSDEPACDPSGSDRSPGPTIAYGGREARVGRRSEEGQGREDYVARPGETSASPAGWGTSAWRSPVRWRARPRRRS